jgi:hypothetical protein
VDLSDDFEPFVMLADAENFTGLGACDLVLLTQEEAEHVADEDDLPMVKERFQVVERTYDVEDVVRWALGQSSKPLLDPTLPKHLTWSRDRPPRVYGFRKERISVRAAQRVSALSWRGESEQFPAS